MLGSKMLIQNRLLLLTTHNRFIRSNNVARISGVSERTVRKWAQSGLLAAYKHGPKIWFFKKKMTFVRF
jgi:hypothetical protein